MSAKTFEVGTRVYHTDIERQGVVTGIGAFPNTLRIRATARPLQRPSGSWLRMHNDNQSFIIHRRTTR